MSTPHSSWDIVRASAIVALIVILGAVGIAPAHADLSHDRADLVWGQPSPKTSSCSPTPTATTLCQSRAATVDNRGNLWVADTNRVLMFPHDPTTGHPGLTATKVFGQLGNFSSNGCNQPPAGQPIWMATTTAESLCRPTGIAIDQSETLYIADNGNNRVLVYANAPDKPTSPAADLVLGQPNFTSSSPNDTPGSGSAPFSCVTPASASQCSLNSPTGVSVDLEGDLVVADSWNNRVLLWPAATLAHFVSVGCQIGCFIPATRVWGQSGSFTTNTTNGTTTAACALAPPTATTLECPEYALADSNGNLFIADSWNNRILEFAHALAQDTQMPSAVFGQSGSFTSGVQDLGGTSASSLSYPSGMVFDSAGNLWVTDTANSRVLRFPYSVASGRIATTADWVMGTGGLFNGVGLCTAASTGSSTLCEPNTVAFDATGMLYVADSTANRVLGYTGAAPPMIRSPQPSATPTSTAIPTASPMPTQTKTPTPTPTAAFVPTPTTAPTPTSTASLESACGKSYTRVHGTCAKVAKHRAGAVLSVQVWVSPSTVHYGQYATLYAKTRTGAACHASLVYTADRRSIPITGRAKKAGSSGIAHWSWHEETTGPEGSAVASCEWHGQVKTASAHFRVIR